MKKITLLITLVCLIVLFSGTALALRISLEEETTGKQTITLYPPFPEVTFNIIISGLGDHSDPSLGAFDLDILFNPAVLEYVSGSAVFGQYLGNDPFGQWVDGPNPGPTYGGIDYDAVRIQELSLEPTQWLYDNQPDNFTLATLTFRAPYVCHSYIIPDNIVLSDALGNIMTCSSIGIGSVTIIPEPATLLLLGCGLLGGTALKRRKKRETHKDKRQ